MTGAFVRFAAAATALAWAGPAPALTLWQGSATILSATPTCFAESSERRQIRVGSLLRTLYRPKLVDDNGNDSRISFIHDGQTNFALILPGGAADGTSAAFGVGHNGVLVANQGVVYDGFVLTPTAVDATTPFFELRGSIRDFLFIAGCRVTFRAAYSARDAALATSGDAR